MIATAISLTRQSDRVRRQGSVLTSRESQISTDPNSRFGFQLKIFAYFYAAAAVIDWLIYFTGAIAIKNKDLLCYNKSVIVVNSNLGGFYMLAFSFVEYFYALFMWYAFYYVIRKYGGVTRRSVDDVGILLDGDTTIVENEENLKTVVRELEHDRRFTKKQQSK